MNERIADLLEQAFNQSKKYEDGDEKGLVKTTEALSIFAELIIRECAMLVEGFTINQEVALDDYQEYEASAVLKEHFGVE
jgi:hypothetical protein